MQKYITSNSEDVRSGYENWRRNAILKDLSRFEQSKETVSTQNGFYLTVSKIKLAFSPFYGKLALEKRFASMLFKHVGLHYFHK